MRQVWTVGLMTVVLGLAAAAAQAAPLNLDMGDYPRVLAYYLSVDYDANFYSETGHGRLLVGMDGDGYLTGWPQEVWTSATDKLQLDWDHMDDSGNYDVVFGFWAEIDHSGSAAVPVNGGLLVTGDFDGTWTNKTKPEGLRAIPGRQPPGLQRPAPGRLRLRLGGPDGVRV